MSWVCDKLYLLYVAHFVHRKSHIRGALTTGMKWHFIVVDIDAHNDGAKCWVSELIEWRAKRSSTSGGFIVEEAADDSDPALIAGTFFIMGEYALTLYLF